MVDADIKESIERYIAHVRQMSALSDGELRLLLTKAAEDNPEMFETLRQGAAKKMVSEMKKMAQDVHGDAVKFARRIA